MVEECEICGTRMKDVYIVNVDEVELRVCTKCSRGKKVMSAITAQSKMQSNSQKPKSDRNEAPQLVENYGAKIRIAREAMKLPLKVLAEMINEKETLLYRVEQERTMPSIELTKKLEKALGIKLSEVGAMQVEKVRQSKNDGATLGEFIGSK